MNITNDIIYVGVNDKDIDLFEGQYRVPNGMAYNSYVILDEKTAVMDSVDARFRDEWLCNIKKALAGRNCDYLIVQHMEPDHSANIISFAKEYPDAKIVSSQRAFSMMGAFYGNSFDDRRIIAADTDTLCLGKHKLTFYTAPMVHWPEVIVTYDNHDKVLFSADGFGKFGALDAVEDWACEARRYYFGIVGKYGAQVQQLLGKVSPLEIEKICPLHGPVLSEDLGFYIGLYDTWSSYRPEDEGIVIAYTSIYGNTKKAALSLAEKLRETEGVKVVLHDLARCDIHEAIEDAFRYSKLVLATTTYNGDIFPFMRTFIHALNERGFKNRTVGFIENGTWAPLAAKIMKGMLEGCQNITFTENNVKLISAMNDSSKESVEALARELIG